MLLRTISQALHLGLKNGLLLFNELCDVSKLVDIALSVCLLSNTACLKYFYARFLGESWVRTLLHSINTFYVTNQPCHLILCGFVS